MMGDKTGIAWTDSSWNPVVGCSVVSPGCTACYAMRLAGTRLKDTPRYAGLTQDSRAGPVWTGEVRLIEDALSQPLRWRRPRRIFVNSMGDLFHESVPDAWIDRMFSAMAQAQQHTFQILTKRAERMRRYSQERQRAPDTLIFPWPPPNVWLGVSAEDQVRADERIPLLLDTPAVVRFVSYEPALGKVDFQNLSVRTPGGTEQWDCLDRHEAADAIPPAPNTVIDWIIVGGESGPHARPFDLEWARAVVAQCRASGIACFVKQLGAGPYFDNLPFPLKDRAGADPSEWPEDLRVREFPDARTQRES